MDMQFQKSVYNCLQLWAEDVKNEEQTQEIRLPDAMPDIGTVLGAWGQLLVRSKEWRGTGMTVSGGVMTWVLYAPEDGSMVRTVEGWIPFQMHWDFPQAQQDGKMVAACLLRSVDARCLSARKIMVRTCVSVEGEAMEPGTFTAYMPKDLPEDVQLLRRSYPICFPAEAGEKMFSLDEELTMPSELGDAGKLMYYSLQPEIVDRKIMADKVVFRGMALVRGLFRCTEGELKSGTFEVPFSQYAQLDREYGPNANARVIPAVTGLEMERQEDGRLRLKAGMTGQYVIYDRPMIEVVEDAYSPVRDVKLHTGELEAPIVLDFHREVLRAQQTVPSATEQAVDMVFSVQQPVRQRNAEGMEMLIPGSFTVLGKNDQGGLLGTSVKWEGRCILPADRDSRIVAVCCPTGRPQVSAAADQLQLSAEVAVEAMTLAERGTPMVMGLELGELRESDPDRPSLILRRATGDLWQLAKESGSTEEAIRRANGLQEDPAPGKMLLIPVK